MIVTKKWYVTHDNGIILLAGDRDNNHVETIFPLAEFDSEAELMNYIESEKLRWDNAE